MTTESLLPRVSSLLQQRESELRAAIAADTHGTAHLLDRNDVLDRKDLADEDAQALVDDAFAGRAAKELEGIAAARRRLADGTYGTCLACGEPIDEQRLLALPAAPLCTRCQADIE